jgi:hypothetical protein
MWLYFKLVSLRCFRCITAMTFFVPLLCAQSPAPLGELFASQPGAPPAAQPAAAGMSVASGSELSAGIAPAMLKLARGGQIRICPKSGLSVSAAGQGLMLGMNTGSIEVDYRLGQATDFFVTPDFNVRLAGPAAYHFALGVNSKGDTCIKPLAGNGAGIVFSELLGADTYGIAANEAAVFMGGRLASRAQLTGECGCPEAIPPPITMRAADLESSASNNNTGRMLATTGDGSAPTPPDRPLEVNTPFVFSATAAGGARPNAVAHIQFSSLPNVFFLQEEVIPVVLIEKPADVSIKQEEKSKTGPPQESKKEKKGFMARIKGFFGSIFHR